MLVVLAMLAVTALVSVVVILEVALVSTALAATGGGLTMTGSG